MNVMGYVLFFLAGLGFGYAAPKWGKFLPILFPIALALGAMMKDGFEGEVVLRLVLAVALTIGGIVLGMALDARSSSRQARTA